jgi:hypothetical protein
LERLGESVLIPALQRAVVEQRNKKGRHNIYDLCSAQPTAITTFYPFAFRGGWAEDVTESDDSPVKLIEYEVTCPPVH